MIFHKSYHFYEFFSSINIYEDFLYETLEPGLDPLKAGPIEDVLRLKSYIPIFLGPLFVLPDTKGLPTLLFLSIILFYDSRTSLPSVSFFYSRIANCLYLSLSFINVSIVSPLIPPGLRGSVF